MRLLTLTSLAALWLLARPLSANNETLMLCEGGIPCTAQSWFYSGSNNALQEDKIKQGWDDGYRIMSAAYTYNGWFVTMGKGTGYTMQTYNYTTQEPAEWIQQKWSEGYYITSYAGSRTHWLVVMTQGTGYTQQCRLRGVTFADLKPDIDEAYSEGYRVTCATWSGWDWVIVMSKNSGYAMQTCGIRDWLGTQNDIGSHWSNNDWTLCVLEYNGEGQYFYVLSQYADGHKSNGQNYKLAPANWNDYISERWKEGRYIRYIGGGYQ